MAGDLYFHDVVLLLHCDGTDASTTFTDSSETGHTVTANGDAQLDTAQKKFGSASALFDGTGDYLSIPDSAAWDLGSANFTIEFWVRFNSVPGPGSYVALISQRDTSASNFAFTCWYGGTESYYFSYTTDGTTQIRLVDITSATPSTGQWYHLAWVRSGSSLDLYIDSVKQTTQSIGTNTIYNSSAVLKIGATNSTPTFFIDGWLDDVRITKGVARSITSAPTEAFPDYREVPGTGALASAAAAIAGTGSAISFLTGTGALAAQSGTIAGTGSAISFLTGTGALSAQSSSISGTGSLPMRSCFYAWHGWTPGTDYLSRAMGEAPSGTKWTWASRVYVPSSTYGTLVMLCLWRSGNTAGAPAEAVEIYLSSTDPNICVDVSDGLTYPFEFYSDGAITAEEWHDVVVHYDSANPIEADRVVVYVDDARQAAAFGTVYPSAGYDTWSILSSPYIVLNGYGMDGTASYCGALAFADTIFLSARTVIPAAVHDYCGGYNAADWHLRYQTSSVGTDSSGNGFDFTEAGTGNWIEPTGDLCLEFTFPITLDNAYRVEAGIPITFRVKSTPTLPTLPITVGAYAVTASLPVTFRLSSTPTLPTLPVAIYGNASATIGSDAIATWRPKCVIGGTDVSARLIGGGEVEMDEMAASVASFSMLPATGTVDPLAYVGKSVTLAIETIEAGVKVGEYLIFTGTVSDPTWSVDDRVLTISATSDLQSVFDGMTKAEIDTQLAAFAPTYSEIVFGVSADLSGWEYAEALLSTINAVLWQDPGGIVRVSSTLPKVSADHTFENSGTFVGSDLSYPARMDMINKREIAIDYRFERKRSREIDVSFRPWQLITPEVWLSCEGGWDLPQRDQIESAATSGGWYPIADIAYVDVWPNDLYTTRSCAGVNFMAGLSVADAIRDTLCVGANWTAARRWLQTVTETATITVGASESQAVVGVLADAESYGYESEYTDEEWEDSLEEEDYSTSGMTQMASGDYKLDLDTDRTDFEDAQEVAIAKARCDILKSHRGTTLTFQTTFQPQIDLSHTVHVDCSWVEAQGKVRRVTHAWDIDSGALTSEIAVALYRHNGAGLVTDTPVAATTKAADPDETSPETILQLPMYIGGRDDKPPYDEDWTGYIVNMPVYESASTDPVDRGQVWSRSPLNPAVQRYEPEGFHMKYPDIDASYVDPLNAAAVADFDVAIPEDLLVLTA